MMDITTTNLRGIKRRIKKLVGRSRPPCQSKSEAVNTFAIKRKYCQDQKINYIHFKFKPLSHLIPSSPSQLPNSSDS